MASIRSIISSRLSHSISKVIPGLRTKAIVNPEHQANWHYSSPSAIQIFNQNKKKSGVLPDSLDSCHKIATEISADLMNDNNVFEKVELAQLGRGPSEKSPFFMNFFLKTSCIEEVIKKTIAEEVSFSTEPSKILIDFSSPNIAKNMHVGHLRSTIIGDSISRVLEFTGNDVQRINHIGDWGTQFGMLITHLDSAFPNYLDEVPSIDDLQSFYQEAKRKFDQDPKFQERARRAVVNLQKGEQKEISAWKVICKISKVQYDNIYKRLDIKIKDVGESFYNDMIPSIISDLERKKIIVESDGCKCIFVKNDEIPLIIRKSDGGYTYDSTDLAAINYRFNQLGVDKIIYLTDIGQRDHFTKIFKAAHMSGIYDPKVQTATHLGLGLMRGDDGGKIKSRSGESVKLNELLDEATFRAKEILLERQNLPNTHNDLEKVDINDIAEKIAMNSIKYFDLKQSRASSYKFSYDRMLDTKGNTGVYITYMYARICSIIRRCYPKDSNLEDSVSRIREEFLLSPSLLSLQTPEEISLCLAIARFYESIEDTLIDYQLSKICDNLYNISVKFAEFYQTNKVLNHENQTSRLIILLAAKLTMERQMELLGMKSIENI
ncbi:unnamed protein product [Moneuplotes crassus]|uniref:arginine--tRNA ligase n=1 Tax=Euplotes crassus TaxID=5936 RepID=A0AAD1X9R7_EUPCR|nr:unnamed protein product [Moneuplotes crassus]